MAETGVYRLIYLMLSIPGCVLELADLGLAKGDTWLKSASISVGWKSK